MSRLWPGAASLDAGDGYAARLHSFLPILLLLIFLIPQGVVPVFGWRTQTPPITASALRDRTKSTGKGFALHVAIGGGDKRRTGARGKRSEGVAGGRRSAAAGAEIDSAVAKALDRGETHRVDCRLRHAETICVGRTQAEQHLGAASGEPSPFRPALLPADDRTGIIGVGGPHAPQRPSRSTPCRTAWAKPSGRGLLADPSRVDRGRSGTGPGRHQ